MQVVAAVAGSAVIATAVPAAVHLSGPGPGTSAFGQAAGLRFAATIVSPPARRGSAATSTAAHGLAAHGPAATSTAANGPAANGPAANGPAAYGRGPASKPIFAAKAAGARPAVVASPAALEHRTDQAAALPVYLNPFRGVSGLVPERIDMGVDFGGSGPVYALGNAVITGATAANYGWPGGGWITYRLTDGPAAGLMVYVAEDVVPTVQVGQVVTPETVIANMFAGNEGIETGWAQPDGSSAESQLPSAGSISGTGPFPTVVGVNFEQLLRSLGVPAANNFGQAGFGVLPPNYPASYPSA
ncbi:MAG TPA: hypothetical protein VNF47_09245 [Streptosporangiaceae bacterium]|nr:hypothetical protein [Streptosporangiaceae bacterium]